MKSEQPHLQPFSMDTLKSLLDQLEITYFRLENMSVLGFSFQLQQTEIRASIYWQSTPGLLQLDLMFPFLVPEERAGAVRETTARINRFIRPGRFEYEPDPHHLSYRVFHVIMEGDMTLSQLDFMLSSGLFLCGRLYRPLHDLCFGDVEPSDVEMKVRELISTIAPDGAAP